MSVRQYLEVSTCYVAKGSVVLRKGGSGSLIATYSCGPFVYGPKPRDADRFHIAFGSEIGG